MDKLQDILAVLGEKKLRKIVISKPASKKPEFRKITAELINDYYHIAQYTDTQVFHKNIPQDSFSAYLEQTVSGRFLQINAWEQLNEHIVLISKKGSVTYSTKPSAVEAAPGAEHNRRKNYLLPEGNVIPPLIDMGIFTKEGKIVKAMNDKFQQINRMLEIIDDEVKNYSKETLNIIDFGCGKSYLTFILYYYLTEIARKKVRITGLDLKAEVIKKCNLAAQKYGYSDLSFELGDIKDYKPPFEVDMVITLHACDTATDYALFNAVSWSARMIFSIPCCQHELNKQIKSDNFSVLTRYGIIKERFSALATDAIRGNLLECCNYKTQLLEFIDFEHTPKNILIRAVKKNGVKNKNQRYLDEVEAFIKEFNVTPTLYSLLLDSGLLKPESGQQN